MRVADVPNQASCARTVERHALNSQDRAMTEFWYDPLVTSRLLANSDAQVSRMCRGRSSMTVWTLQSSQSGNGKSGVKSKPIGHVSKHGPRSIACVQV